MPLLERIGAALLLAGCVNTTPPPDTPTRAQAGEAPESFRADLACGDWRAAVAGEDTALGHVAFPGSTAPDCRAVVASRGAGFDRPEVSPGCGYPRHSAETAARLDRVAAELESWGDGRDWPNASEAPFAFACPLPPEVRRRVAHVNVQTLRHLARAIRSGVHREDEFAYGAVLVFGFGMPPHDESRLRSWLPGDACPELDRRQMELFDVNRERAYRAAAAAQAGVAPVVIASGSAVHSQLYETFLLGYLMHCRFGLPWQRILLEPCARHTHENLRNAGGVLASLGARHGYIMTDRGLQAAYLDDRSLADWLGLSIDQRALDDFGFLVGSWRHAARGFVGGYWYTPYRFWASSAHADFTCLR